MHPRVSSDCGCMGLSENPLDARAWTLEHLVLWALFKTVKKYLLVYITEAYAALMHQK